MNDTKLGIGSVIVVHGFVMLKGLDDGCRYRVTSMPPFYGIPTYQFKKIGSRRKPIRHAVDSVDLWIKSSDNPDLNKIVVE